ncbi:MAG: DUF1822 family protein [Cyanobacteria bacterium P01_D01_bin.44]
MDFGEALELVNEIVISNMGRSLRNPEIAILEGTWNGLTYEQIAHASEYSTNYLMRDVAPKLWKFLSDALGISVGKTNFRIVLDEVAGKNSILTQLDTPVSAALSSTPVLTTPGLQTDWALEGYPEGLATLRQWILKDRCRLLSIYGLSGAGKTVLARHLVESIGNQFEQVIWQSSIPPLNQLVESIAGPNAQAPMADPVSDFLEVLSQRACLIVMDAVESILQPGQLAGHYCSGYENYGQLLRRVGELPHRSCLVITGLENPPEIVRLSGQSSSVRTLHLKAFSETAAVAILEAEQLTDQDCWPDLIRCYQGNPAALRIASQMIRELFNGSVEAFLAQKSFAFGSINLLLKRSFERVSQLERDILFWLAGKNQPVSLATLQVEIPLVVNTTEMLEALESLIQRSLLETTQATDGFLFLLQPIVKEYVIHQFIAQVCGESSAGHRVPPRTLGPIIELGASTPKIARLSRWFQHQFEPGWQPVERLFEGAVQPALRLRSAYHLRDETLIKRFKSITLERATDGDPGDMADRAAEGVTAEGVTAEGVTAEGVTAESVTVALLVAVSQMIDQTYQICVQVQPARQAAVLPEGLRLRLLDGQSEMLAEIESHTQDDFMQLPYFRGNVDERFNLELVADQATHTEQFVI